MIIMKKQDDKGHMRISFQRQVPVFGTCLFGFQNGGEQVGALTPKQERFCAEYLVDYNATQAAIRAGYSEKTAGSAASRMLKNVEVLARVREMQKDKIEKLCVTSDFVVMKLLETLAQCMAAVPVMEWSAEEHKKVPSGEFQFDSRGATKCLELIGKHLGMFEDKVNVNASVNTGRLDQILAQLRGDTPDG